MRSTVLVKCFFIVGILTALQSQGYLCAQLPPLPFVSLIDGTDLENYWKVKLEHMCDNGDVDVFYTVRKLDLNNDFNWKVIVYTQNTSNCNLVYSFNFKTLQERNIQSMNGFRQVLDWSSVESGYIRADVGVSRVEFVVQAYLNRGWRIEFGYALIDRNKASFGSLSSEEKKLKPKSFVLKRSQTLHGFNFYEKGVLKYIDQSFDPEISVGRNVHEFYVAINDKKRGIAIARDIDGINKYFIIDFENMISVEGGDFYASMVFMSPNREYFLVVEDYEDVRFIIVDFSTNKIFVPKIQEKDYLDKELSFDYKSLKWNDRKFSLVANIVTQGKKVKKVINFDFSHADGKRF